MRGFVKLSLEITESASGNDKFRSWIIPSDDDIRDSRKKRKTEITINTAMNTKTINKLRRVLKTEENETSILVLEKL